MFSSRARKKLRAFGVSATAAFRGTNFSFLRGLFFVCDEDGFDANGDFLVLSDVVEKEIQRLSGKILATNRDPPREDEGARFVTMHNDIIGRLLPRESACCAVTQQDSAMDFAIRFAMTDTQRCSVMKLERHEDANREPQRNHLEHKRGKARAKPIGN